MTALKPIISRRMIVLTTGALGTSLGLFREMPGDVPNEKNLRRNTSHHFGLLSGHMIIKEGGWGGGRGGEGGGD